MITCNKVLMLLNTKIDEGLSLIILALDVCTLTGIKTDIIWSENTLKFNLFKFSDNCLMHVDEWDMNNPLTCM